MTVQNMLNSPQPFSVLTGGTGVTSVTTAPAATAWAGWDANSNFSANNFLGTSATIPTAASTTTLTVASAGTQFFTGTTTQTVLLPVTSTLALNQSFTIINNSTGVVTVQSSGANTVQVMAAGTTAIFNCILQSGTTAASWSVTYINSAGGGGGITTLAGNTGTATGSTVTITGSTTGLTFTGASATLTLGGTLAVANGGTAKTSVTIAPTANAWAGWDANSNLSANIALQGYTTTNTSAGTVTMTVASTYNQYFTGSTAGLTVTLPLTDTLQLGTSFRFVNNSSVSVTIIPNGIGTVQIMAAGTSLIVTSIASTSFDGPNSWDKQYAANNPLASGSWIKLGSVSLTGASLANFSLGSATYQAFAIIINNAIPVTNTTNLLLTYNAISSNYEYAINGAGNSGTSSNIILNSTTISNSGGGLSGIIFVYNGGTILSGQTNVTWNVGFGSTGGSAFTTTTGAGTNSSTAALTSITLEMSSGNFTSGEIEWYGIVA